MFDSDSDFRLIICRTGKNMHDYDTIIKTKNLKILKCLVYINYTINED